MEKSTLFFPFEVKAVADSGRFTGYASTFGNVDLQDDVMEPGAFKDTLAKHGGKVPILFNHSYNQLIGWGITASEDSRGLHVEGELTIATDLGRNVHELAKHALKLGQQLGLSIGYSILPKGSEQRQGIRRLKAVELHEYSVTPFPANPEARLSAVKQADAAYAHLREMVKDRKSLREVLQRCFSRREVVKLLADSPEEQGLELELAEQRCGTLLKGLVQVESNVRWGHLLSAVRPDITDPLELEALARRMAPECPLDAKVSLSYQVPAKTPEPEKSLGEKLRDEQDRQEARDRSLKELILKSLELDGIPDEVAKKLGIGRDAFLVPGTPDQLLDWKEDHLRHIEELRGDIRHRETVRHLVRQGPPTASLDQAAFYRAVRAAADLEVESVLRQIKACTDPDDLVDLCCEKLGMDREGAREIKSSVFPDEH